MSAMRVLMTSGLLIGLLAATAPGQVEVAGLSPGEEVSLADEMELLEEVEPRPLTHKINSAITLTNPSGRAIDFKIALVNQHGQWVGGGNVTVPARGMKVFWVSRLLDDPDERFVGYGIAAMSSRGLAAHAFLAGVGVSKLPVSRYPDTNSDVATRRLLFSVLAVL